MNVNLRRLLLPILREAKHSSKFRIRSAAEQALHLVQKPSKKGKAPAAARKQAKQSKHRDETAALREAVFQRANGFCELGDQRFPQLASELHHLEGGSGRRALQTIENCVASCARCHREFHADPEQFRLRVLEWCNNYRYPVIRRFRGEPKDLGLAKEEA